MYEDRYDLTDAERSEAREILADMAARGGRLTDPAGRAVPYRILRGRRFLVCDKGLVWRFAPQGAPRAGGAAGGPPRRNGAVEMWTGRWRRAPGPDGAAAWRRCLVWVPLEDHINGHAGVSKIGWYRSEKGFRHPLEGPDQPDEHELAALADRREAVAAAVSARLAAEGLEPAGEADRNPAPPPADRTAPARAETPPDRKGHRHGTRPKRR